MYTSYIHILKCIFVLFIVSVLYTRINYLYIMLRENIFSIDHKSIKLQLSVTCSAHNTQYTNTVDNNHFI